MDNKTCQHCVHFTQHYGIDNDRVHWVNSGFCRVDCRPKHRRAMARACEKFVMDEKPPTISRKRLILTVEKLREILNRELPPECPDEE